MIDRDARKILGKNLQGLVEGTITSDQFSCSRPISKGDRAIDGIWGFGDSLYSDIASYTLKGKYAVNNKSYDIAQRCILFLATDMEYMWPDLPKSPGVNMVFAGVILGMISAILNALAQFLDYLFIPASIFFGTSFFLFSYFFFIRNTMGVARRFISGKLAKKTLGHF